VSLVVRAGVLVNLDDDDARLSDLGFDPVSVDQDV
jgi:hypothetical protein